MGEKRIDELNDAQYPSYYHYLPIDRDVAAETAKLKTDYFGRANDSSDIRCLGNTNTTGAIIPSGKYFYKYDTYHSNRALAKAISNIAVNATLTQNTNFKYVTIGEELDSLNAALTNRVDVSSNITKSSYLSTTDNLSAVIIMNKIAIVYGNIAVSTAPGSGIALLYGLPKPKDKPIVNFVGDNKTFRGYIEEDSLGVVVLHSYGTTNTGWFSFNLAYEIG